MLQQKKIDVELSDTSFESMKGLCEKYANDIKQKLQNIGPKKFIGLPLCGESSKLKKRTEILPQNQSLLQSTLVCSVSHKIVTALFQVCIVSIELKLGYLLKYTRASAPEATARPRAHSGLTVSLNTRDGEGRRRDSL
ncbi:hypothetical protein Pelo_16983 [Pelomyxa schiedti]|nr:hypothetical protein Pelo_16983 [Pelomyxa schiedti]